MLLRPGIALVAALVVPTASAAAPAVRTFVDLVASDADAPHLGRPSVRVVVDGARVAGDATLGPDLSADLLRLVHARPLGEGERGDWILDLTLRDPGAAVGVLSLRFEARLLEPNGRQVWHAAGRTEVEGGPLDGAAFASLRRNVIAALIRDGWFHAKVDPEHPAPPPPVIRRDGR